MKQMLAGAAAISLLAIFTGCASDDHHHRESRDHHWDRDGRHVREVPAYGGPAPYQTAPPYRGPGYPDARYPDGRY